MTLNIFKLQTLTEAGVTTPLTLPVDTNDRDIKNAKPIKDAAYRIQRRTVSVDRTPQKVGGMLYTKNLYESMVPSYVNG